MAKKKLDWFPLFIHRIKGSGGWKDMQDFERGWYISLLVESADSERMGYLPITDKLYLSAGARSRSFFEKNFWTGLVGARFTRSEFGGREWVSNPTMLEVLETQMQKLSTGKTPPSPHSSLLSKGSGVALEELDASAKRVFAIYHKTFARAETYRLTDTRKKKYQMRVMEVMSDEKCSLEQAESLAIKAIKNVAADPFFVDGGYYDWIDTLFGSQDTFQKRLDMKPKAKKHSAATVGMPIPISAAIEADHTDWEQETIEMLAKKSDDVLKMYTNPGSSLWKKVKAYQEKTTA